MLYSKLKAHKERIQLLILWSLHVSISSQKAYHSTVRHHVNPSVASSSGLRVSLLLWIRRHPMRHEWWWRWGTQRYTFPPGKEPMVYTGDLALMWVMSTARV